MATRGFFGRRPEPEVDGRLPPGQHLTHDFPVLSAGPTPRVSTDTWAFTLKDGPRPVMKWSWDEFNALPQTKFHRDIHCVTTWSKFDTNWEGVLIDDIFAAAGLEPPTAFTLAHAFDGYSTNVPLADLAGPRRRHDDVDHPVHGSVVDDDLHANLRHEVHGVLRTAVHLGVALLPPVALHFADRHTQHAQLFQAGLDVFEGERLDDRSDQLHISYTSAPDREKTELVPATAKSYAVSACSASSMPAASASRSSRSPMVYLTSKAKIAVPTAE